MQKFQDWFTQKWVILFGKKIEHKLVPWLIGPIGKVGSISDEYIYNLANEESLIVKRNNSSQGLITSMSSLKLTDNDTEQLSQEVIDFYEHTANYDLKYSVNWSPFFKILGKIISKFFSNRIEQLNIPIKNSEKSIELISELITLSDSDTKDIIYTIWYRTFKETGQVLYSGFYSVCKMPSGKSCVKAVFPLPNGNATVIMSTNVGKNGELILNSSGRKFGDPGFYFY